MHMPRKADVKLPENAIRRWKLVQFLANRLFMLDGDTGDLYEFSEAKQRWMIVAVSPVANPV